MCSLRLAAERKGQTVAVHDPMADDRSGYQVRPTGISSRVSPARGPRHPWQVGNIVIDLPVVVDWVCVDTAGCEDTRVEVRIDLVAGAPQVVDMTLTAPHGLDLSTLQRDFRWASPLEVVTGLMPRLMESGTDPYAVDLPLNGFPAVAVQQGGRRALSDEFLLNIAREYTIRGRGYATSLAAEFCVTPRTVVSWVEKARSRGLLTRPSSRGAIGGEIARGR